jgi:pimeloyl-ACP methyl ester carboxylesterase
MKLTATLLALVSLALPAPAQDAMPDDLYARVTHHFADSGGVRIHYVKTGEGPLVVMIHGFPDYWYTWRHQMEVLENDYTVVAIDQRGYNRSDAPEGVDAYAMSRLVGDVVAVVNDVGAGPATIVGHDWGAAVAWQVAMNVPGIVERLVILSVPHPAGFGRELKSNEEQKADSQYARDFQAPDSHESLTAEGLAGWVAPEARERYVQAFERSSFDGMMNYYRRNYPSGQGSSAITASSKPSLPRIQCPVLVLHGLQDRALHASGHNGTWDWVDEDTTLVMFPRSGHFLQHDEAEKVSLTILDWLSR